MKKLNRAKLNYKIFLTISATLCTLFFLGSWVTYTLMHSIITTHLEENLSQTVVGIRQIVQKSAALSIRSYLHGLAEQYSEIANHFYQQSLAGKISKEEAQKAVEHLILPRKIGPSGYIYVLDSNAIVKIHPKTGVIGRNVHDQDFVKMQIKLKKGFLEYEWKNPSDKQKRQKILYMDYFEPWDWIISVSAYREELAQLIQPEDFRDEILSIQISANSHPFVIDQNGNVLTHPELRNDVLQDNAAFADFIQKLIDSKKGKLFHDWVDPVDGKLKKKVVIYDTIDEFNWIVAVTGNVDDFYSPLNILRNILIALLVLGLFSSFLISYYLSKSITSPLNNLLQNLSEHSDDISINESFFSEKNEIEALSAYFASYIQQLKENNINLKSLYSEQKTNSLNLSIFKEIFDNVVEGIAITDLAGNIVLVNPAFTKITGYSADEVIGRNPRILKSDRHPPTFYDNMWEEISSNGFWAGEVWNKRKNGEIYPGWLTISTVNNRDGKSSHYAAVFNDITPLVEQQEKIHFLAYHDHLTDLPNRLLILNGLHQSIAECQQQNCEIACMVIDLDNFKIFNDSMGQQNGDLLLKNFVDRLEPELRTEGSFGRIGGDDFILILSMKPGETQQIFSILDLLFKSVDTPFEIADHKIHLTLNIGIAVFPGDAGTSDDLFTRANLAQHRAKKSKGNAYSFFSTDMEKAINKKLHYLEKIRVGIERQEFLPYFQPKVDLTTNEVRGMEALARWKSGGRLVNPGDFIPLAEDSGLIIPLSKQIYEKAFRQTLLYHQQGYDLHLSVNLSPIQFQDEHFMESLLVLQKESGLAAKFIELEVTESILFDNMDYVRKTLKQLTELGFSISIDDFGTGYSSLQYLKHIPLHTLKIDMSFVSGIGKDKDDENLVQTIAILAKQFGLKIVAEGVERQDQVDFLRNLECEDGQGYFYGKPMSGEDFTQWLETSKNS